MVQASVYSFILFLSLVGLGTSSHLLQRGDCGCSASFSVTKPVVPNQTCSLFVHYPFPAKPYIPLPLPRPFLLLKPPFPLVLLTHCNLSRAQLKWRLFSVVFWDLFSAFTCQWQNSLLPHVCGRNYSCINEKQTEQGLKSVALTESHDTGQ